MNLLLVSGWPGAGKTVFGQWPAANRGFVHVETDAQPNWISILSARDLQAAASARNRMCELGPEVVIEWGFVVSLLPCIRLLRTVGFDCWWFDGDHDAALDGYVQRRGRSPSTLATYQRQTSEITAAWARISAFYGDRVVHTVAAEGARAPFPELANRILATPASAASAP